jgi:hypothetical protein
MQDHRNYLCAQPNYISNPTWAPSTIWKQKASGHVLTEKGSGDVAVGIVVRRVLDAQLYVGPVGNYNGKYALNNAKYQFVLCLPDNTPFSDDWGKSTRSMENVQQAVASTKSHQHFLTTQKQFSNL